MLLDAKVQYFTVSPQDLWHEEMSNMSKDLNFSTRWVKQSLRFKNMIRN